MDGDRFDSLTCALGSGRSRRGILKGLGATALGAVGFSRLGNSASAGGGNSACAQWCHDNFSGSAAGHCTSDAANGTGACYQCGPAAPAGNGQLLCAGVCLDTTHNAANCGACGHVCLAVDACTPAQCSSGTCNQTSSCTGFQTCGGGGSANACGCTPATTCPGGQNCGTAPDGCGGTVSCGSCTAPANAAATCASGTCGFTCNDGYQLNAAGDACVAISLCPPGLDPVNGGCFQIVAGLDESLCVHSCHVYGSVDGSGNYLCGSHMAGTSCTSSSNCPSGAACFNHNYCIAVC